MCAHDHEACDISKAEVHELAMNQYNASGYISARCSKWDLR